MQPYAMAQSIAARHGVLAADLSHTAWQIVGRQHMRLGFTNANLAAGLALLAVLSLLLLIQSGEISPLSWFGSAKKPAGGKGKKSATPLLFSEEEEPADALAADDNDGDEQAAVIAVPRQWRIQQALAQMHGADAANLLAQLDPSQAVEILERLKPRDLARILEEAGPQVAAGWIELLTAEPAPPEPPQEPADEEAGLAEPET